MHLIGRWEKVRMLTPRGWGLPWMLDRKWNRFLPHSESGEWWRSPEGIWMPTIRGGGLLSGTIEVPRPYLGFGESTSFNQDTLVNLNTAYTYGSAGGSTAMRGLIPVTLTLNDVYIWINNYGGTASLVTSLNVEHRNDNPDKPGATLRDSAVVNPSSASGWVKCTGFTVAVTGGTIFWILLADADASGVNFAVTRTGQNMGAGGNQAAKRLGSVLNAPFSTANGYSTISAGNGIPVFVLHFSDGSVFGNPFSTAGTVTSDTNQKGLNVSAGFTAGVRLFAVLGFSNNTGWNAIKIYSSNAGPTTTPAFTSTLGIPEPAQSSSASLGGFLFSSPIKLDPGTPYRIVFAYGSANGNPQKLQIGTGTDANLRAAMLGGGDWVYTVENATPGWTDDTNGFPQMALMLEDLGNAPALALAVSDGLR